MPILHAHTTQQLFLTPHLCLSPIPGWDSETNETQWDQWGQWEAHVNRNVNRRVSLLLSRRSVTAALLNLVRGMRLLATCIRSLRHLISSEATRPFYSRQYKQESDGPIANILYPSITYALTFFTVALKQVWSKRHWSKLMICENHQWMMRRSIPCLAGRSFDKLWDCWCSTMHSASHDSQ